jgi:hypothetical protein
LLFGTNAYEEEPLVKLEEVERLKDDAPPVAGKFASRLAKVKGLEAG